jgi:hypothetical protein
VNKKSMGAEGEGVAVLVSGQSKPKTNPTTSLTEAVHK